MAYTGKTGIAFKMSIRLHQRYVDVLCSNWTTQPKQTKNMLYSTSEKKNERGMTILLVGLGELDARITVGGLISTVRIIEGLALLGQPEMDTSSLETESFRTGSVFPSL